jgi:tripartite ATP-independent transporter DctP family solute receptor
MRHLPKSVAWLLVGVLALAGGCARSGRGHLVKVGVTHGPSHSFTLALERFGDDLERRTDGRYRVRVYSSGQIGDEKSMQEMLTIGTLEMTVTGLLNTYEPLFALFELPYLYRDREHAFRVGNSQVMQDVAESIRPQGLRLVGLYENGFRHITNSKRPIRVPTDLAGLLIRTPENPAQIETFRALGAIPTPLSFSEVYTSLLQGVVDGQENPLQQIYLSRLYEAQPHCALTGHIYNSAYVLMSERFFRSLDDADRTVFRDCIRDSARWQLDYMASLDADLEQKLRDEGMEFTEPDRDAFRAATLPAHEALVERLGGRAAGVLERIKAVE